MPKGMSKRMISSKILTKEGSSGDFGGSQHFLDVKHLGTRPVDRVAWERYGR